MNKTIIAVVLGIVIVIGGIVLSRNGAVQNTTLLSLKQNLQKFLKQSNLKTVTHTISPPVMLRRTSME